MSRQIPQKLCGRPLNAADVETIHREIRLADPPIRSEIARRVCRALEWTNALGQPKLMSARVGLLRLHRAGIIELPAPTGGNGNGQPLKLGPKEWPPEQPLGGSAGVLTGLRLSPVTDKGASRLWNGLIDRYHYLGYTPAAGRAVALSHRVGPRTAGGAGLRCGGLEGGLARPLDRLGARHA